MPPPSEGQEAASAPPSAAPSSAGPSSAVAPSPEAAVPLAAPLDSGTILTRIADHPRPSRGIYLLAAAVSLLWLGGAAGLAYRYGRGALAPETIALLALVALAPVGLIWAAAYAVAQARVLGFEARRAKRLTDELIGPTALAAAQAGAVVEAMRGQIATASEVANQAKDHLVVLREALAQQTEQLAEATAHASRTAVTLVETLSRERGELNTLAVTLDARSAAVTDAINRQARMVAEASDLAETQLREAEATLAARAADLAAAAGEAVDASRIAADDLGRQVGRLEVAGTGVGDQVRSLEEGLTQQRAALVTVAHALRADQEDFASLAESRTAQLAEFITSSRGDIVALNEATSEGARSLSDLIGQARAKFHELAEAAAEQRDGFARSAEDTLKGLSEAGAREREQLDAAMRSTLTALSTAATEAREAAEVHAEAARARVDLLNEAAFAAGQKADQVFEARLTEARGLIEQSAKLVEEAGDRAAAKLDVQVTDIRKAFDGLGAMVEDLAARTARLPQDATAQAQEITKAVEQGLSELMAASRRAAEETQAIDAAFQERVRRNYEMLSEAVQLMGVVASRGSDATALTRPSAVERGRSRIGLPALPPAAPEPLAAPPAAAPPAAAAAPTDGAPAASGPAPSSASPAAQPSEPGSGETSLRGRLRLTPTASEQDFKAVFNAVSGAPTPAAEESAWTWKELLTSIDGEAAGDDVKLGEALFAEIEGMGIDPAALLPRARVEEIAAVIQTGDAGGAREVVRALAPAAIRRLSRRLLSDAAFRSRGRQLVGRYADLVQEAARLDKQGFQAAALLTSGAGRAYLLLDALAAQLE